jgi:autotransporter translocation and assembly factor TamB
MQAARFENLSIPAMRNFRVRIAFDEREARLEQIQGEVAGGRINVGGRVGIADLQHGAVNVTVQANDVLVLRDDNITARVNANVKAEGPISSALVSGKVGLTKSRFLKDIDILPLRLPGEQRKPAAAPPPPRPRNTGQQFGINTPPLRDWRFDLSIVTDDPFRVRGNLANGRINVNLRLTGTGAKPLLDGPVTVEQLTARLPFSRLDINYGTIYFTPDQPFNPTLNLNGESQIRDRRVNVTIFGRANDPKTAFTSDPPLSQDDILVLLATGSTPDELRGDSGALAGKAAILAAQSLWRKIFPSKEPPPGQESLADRFDVDIGSTDPRTGKQNLTARFRATDRVMLVSDFDSEGNFRGQVRYLIRFR